MLSYRRGLQIRFALIGLKRNAQGVNPIDLTRLK